MIDIWRKMNYRERSKVVAFLVWLFVMMPVSFLLPEFYGAGASDIAGSVFLGGGLGGGLLVAGGCAAWIGEESWNDSRGLHGAISNIRARPLPARTDKLDRRIAELESANKNLTRQIEGMT